MISKSRKTIVWDKFVEFPPKVRVRAGSEHDFIEMDDVTPGNRLAASKGRRKFNGGGASKFDTGDTLFARITPCLDNRKIAMADVSGPSFGSTEFFVFRARPGVSDKNFVYYLSTTDLLVQSAINSYVGASGRQRADAKFLKRIELEVPDFEVQRKISAVLTAYDDLIDNNRRRIALLEQMAEQLYREWFVRFRFPDYGRAKVWNGIPTGWNVVPLEKAFKFTGGATPAKDTPRFWNDGNINWYTPSDITGADGIFLQRSRDQCSEAGLASCSAKLFPAYSVMMTSRATIGAIGINTTAACTNQGFISCIPNQRYPLGYLYHWLKLAKPHFEALSGGATFPELTKGTFKRIGILTPPQAIVTAFDKHCSPMFKMIESLQEASANLKRSRDLLLPRLISGKLHVDDIDIQFPLSMQDTAA